MKTMDCADVIRWRASAVSSGKPTTTPAATRASGTMSPAAGRFCRRASSMIAPRIAAMTARMDVRNSGAKPPTATRVAGRDPLKMITPMSPLPHPPIDRRMAQASRPHRIEPSGQAEQERSPYNPGIL